MSWKVRTKFILSFFNEVLPKHVVYKKLIKKSQRISTKTSGNIINYQRKIEIYTSMHIPLTQDHEQPGTQSLAFSYAYEPTKEEKLARSVLKPNRASTWWFCVRACVRHAQTHARTDTEAVCGHELYLNALPFHSVKAGLFEALIHWVYKHGKPQKCYQSILWV